LAIANTIASVIPDGELHADYIVPSVFNRAVSEAVAEAVAHAAVASGVARRELPGGQAQTDAPWVIR
jgi:malate dehydrogenase (oxaloacetate-decarboxylating)